jgi:hypothetical protein
MSTTVTVLNMFQNGFSACHPVYPIWHFRVNILIMGKKKEKEYQDKEH